jgi:hypothetical protein
MNRKMSRPRKLIVMVSSVVYGIEDLLNQVYATLEGYGYTVWMSRKGTIPISPNKTVFGNCLEAVNQCDGFLGIVTGRYGSGVAPTIRSITHREIIRSIRRNKLRWFLVHRDVTLARELLKQFRFNEDGTPKNLVFHPTKILDDIRVIEMYERAIRQDLPLSKRSGNWVQPYSTNEEALLFIRSQFEDPERIRKLLKDKTIQGG